jgi:hypothetical protein
VWIRLTTHAEASYKITNAANGASNDHNHATSIGE